MKGAHGYLAEHVLTRLHENIRDQTMANYWPGIQVHPAVWALPESVRKDPAIAQHAWATALTNIRADLRAHAQGRTRNAKRYRQLQTELEERLTRKTPPYLRLGAMDERSHVVSAMVDHQPYVLVQKLAPGQTAPASALDAYWTANNVHDSDLNSLVLTHWILAYHDELLNHAAKA